MYPVLSFTLDVISSACLLVATFTRKFYLHNTSVGQWANDVCLAMMSDKELIFNYLAVSVVSWVASSFLECNSLIHFKKLYSTRLWRCLNWDVWSGLSRSRWLVLMLALTCTVNSLVLTLVVWGTVHHSFENVSQDRSILTFNTIAALMRLLRQFVESLIFIAGIATRDFEWCNSREKKLMGRITFSSFMLLIHTSVSFCNPQVWSVDQLILFCSLLIDVIFRFVLCVWAALNSCCYARAKEYMTFLRSTANTFYNSATTLAFLPVRGTLHFGSVAIQILCMFAVGAIHLASFFVRLVLSDVRDSLHFFSTAANTLYSFAVGTVYRVYSCTLQTISSLYFVVQTVVMFAVRAIRLACLCVTRVLTGFVATWRNYVHHWHRVRPVQVQHPYQETPGHTDPIQGEVVFPSWNVPIRSSHDPHHTQCHMLVDEILKSQHATFDVHSPSVVLPFLSLSNASIHSTDQEPSSRQEERVSMLHAHSSCCTFELSPQPESMLPYLSSQSSHTSPFQPLPVRQGEAIVAPSLPCTKPSGQCSELVVR